MTEILRYSAFTRDGAGGNPAGVVLDASDLDEQQMLRIAGELGYSETSFVMPAADGSTRARVRYFSPLAEVAFCGHATVATGVALADRGRGGRWELSTLAGLVTVETSTTSDGTTAALVSPPAHSDPVPDDVLGRALAALRIEPGDLDPAFPPHVGFAGNHHLVLGLRSEETLAALDYDYDGLARLMAEEDWTTAHLFWAEGPAVFHARDPFPPGGVVEDPATGAAAAAFGGYLRTIGRVPPGGSLTVLQGHHMGAPSRLHVELVEGSESVRVSGTATELPAPEVGS
ncbi:MAG TPA: PhzF family phenazine biosynthesis isomerase [Nocardioides sp.]|nr:PhzF family phenazine biosynthesis isomerase [Nocardioides sp.]